MSREIIEKTFAENGTIEQLSDAQMRQGYDFLGDEPPSFGQFNFVQKQVWLSLQHLLGRSDVHAGSIAGKVNKEAGKGLSSNDFSNDDKATLDVLATGGVVEPKPISSANLAILTGTYYTSGDVPTAEEYKVDVIATDSQIIQTATKGDGTVFTRAFEVGATTFPEFAVKLASEYLLDGDKNQKQINREQTSLNSKFSNRDVFVDDLYAGSGTLRPVSDLYNPSSPVYNPSFTDFASVKAVLTAATAPTDPLDWCAIQTCVNQYRAVHLAAKFYYVGSKSIELPTSCAKLIGRGDMTRIYSDAAIAIKAKDGVRIVHGEYGDFYLLGSNVANSIGFNASAFSYCTVKNIYIRQFGDGFFADGSITPVNKQYSNNIVMNVRSNNNLRDGFRFVGSSEANSANTYIGCEGAGNAGVGFNELIGYSNQTLGCTFQGNTTADLFTDGTRNIHQFYAEGNAKSIKFGSASSFNKIDARTSYPIWNSFTDDGQNNSKSVRSDTKTEQHVFKNPYFEDWVSVNPSNVLPNGSPVLKWFSDASIAKGGGLQVTFNANFQGIIVQGLDPNINYAGQWVTVQVEADTSGVTDLSGFRAYTRDGSTSNQTVGEFAAEALVKTEAGKYKSFTHDIRFPAAIAATPTILLYLAYSGITTSNIIKIRSIKVALGQRDRVGDYSLSVKSAASAADANFTDATSGLNTAWKTPGKLVYNTTRGKMYFAVAAAAASTWRATDGSSDIVPA